jgi:hypothetical protein
MLYYTLFPQSLRSVYHILARFLLPLEQDLRLFFRLKIKYRSTCFKDIFMCTVVTVNKHIQNLECRHHNK